MEPPPDTTYLEQELSREISRLSNIAYNLGSQIHQLMGYTESLPTKSNGIVGDGTNFRDRMGVKIQELTAVIDKVGMAEERLRDFFIPSPVPGAAIMPGSASYYDGKRGY